MIMDLLLHSLQELLSVRSSQCFVKIHGIGVAAGSERDGIAEGLLDLKVLDVPERVAGLSNKCYCLVVPP
jgi:hypothetical protein